MFCAENVVNSIMANAVISKPFHMQMFCAYNASTNADDLFLAKLVMNNY